MSLSDLSDLSGLSDDDFSGSGMSAGSDSDDLGGGVVQTSSYSVLAPSAVLEKREKVIREVSSLLALSPDACQTLLAVNGWSEEKTTGAVFADREAALASIGIVEEAMDVDADSVCDDDCSICFDELSAQNRVGIKACGHYFCDECFREHIAARLDEGGRAASLVSCPAQACRAIVSPSMVAKLMSARHVERHVQAITEMYLLARMNPWKHCPR